MSLINIKCLKQACHNLSLSYRSYDNFGNFVEISIANYKYLFINLVTPFNDEGVVKIAKDKEFTYKILQDVIKMPNTLGFFDPDHFEKFDSFKKEKNLDEIMDKIGSVFKFPLVIKKNSGSKGINVFKCNSTKDSRDVLVQIYNKNSQYYDYVALAQEYVEIKNEYRVVVFDKKIELVYKKDISNAEFTGNISPLHFKDSKAILIEDAVFDKRLENFLNPIYNKLNIRFAGFDIIEDMYGQLVLLEINTRPGFSYFVRDNGEERLVLMYQNILNKIIKQDV